MRLWLYWSCRSEEKLMRKQIVSLFSTLLLLLLMAVSVFAETDRKAVTLETVVVTAKKPEEPLQTGDVDLKETTGFVSVIKREDFEGKMEDLAEVLQKEAAVQVRRSGGLGSFSTVSLRGSSSNQVMIFMDGVLLNDASGGGVDLSDISLSDVEAIEIYRGVTPINFGKASIGGVINIRTLRSKKGFNASATAGYGSFNTRKLAAFINHKPGKWDYLISAGYLASDNDFEMLNDNGTEWNKDDDRWEKRNNAQFDQGNILAKLGYDFTGDVRIDLVNQWFSKDQGLPSWNNSPETETSLNTERNITTLNLTANDIGPLHLNTRTTVDYSLKEELYDDSQGHVGLGRQKSMYTTNRYGGRFFLEWLTDWNMAGFTADFHREEYDPEDLLGNRNPNKSSRDTLSMGLQDSVFLFQDKLTVTPALRYTAIKDKLNSATSISGTPLEEKSRDEDYFNPQIGLKYNPLDWLIFKTNLGEYVREPSFFELFGDRGFIIGNPDLKAEKGINFDAGFEINWLTQYQWLTRISCDAAYFHSDVDDLISFVYDARGIGRAENISEALIQGIEAGIRLDFLKYLRLTGNFTWQNPENQSQIEAFNGKQLPGRFKTSSAGTLEGTYAGFKAFVEYIRETGMYFDSANLLPAKDRNMFNAGISWLYRSFLFSLEGKNLTNDDYQAFNGYPMPGRSYFFSVKYSF